jgi:hypothetical protein
MDAWLIVAPRHGLDTPRVTAPARTRRRPPLLLLAFLLIGAAVVYGGVSIYRDQRSGTPGKAKVSECTGGRKYQPAIRCRGTWIEGGSLLDGGHVVVGSVEGAAFGDVGKTIDVRIHGTDHATKPSLGTPILLWALGWPVVLLSLWGFVAWWRRD